jgi:hypothetical protein
LGKPNKKEAAFEALLNDPVNNQRIFRRADPVKPIRPKTDNQTAPGTGTYPNLKSGK